MNVTDHTTSDPQTSPSSHLFLPAGAIAGIFTAVVLATLLALPGAFLLIRKYRRRNAHNVPSLEEMPAFMDHAAEIDGRRVHPKGMLEMPGDKPIEHELPLDQTSLREMAVEPTCPREMPAIQTSPVELAGDR